MHQQRLRIEPVVYDPALTAKLILLLAELTDSEILCMMPYYLQPGREAGLELLEHELNRRTCPPTKPF